LSRESLTYYTLATLKCPLWPSSDWGTYMVTSISALCLATKPRDEHLHVA